MLLERGRWAVSTLALGKSRLNLAAMIEAALLGGLAAMLLQHASRGTLVFYIHPRYIPLAVVAALALVLAMLVRLRAISGPPSEPSALPYGRYLLLAVPLVLGLVVPVRPLGAEALTGTAMQAGEVVRSNPAAGDDSRSWDLLHWATAAHLRGAEVEGQEADLVGFVYHDATRPFAGFFVRRMVIVCCVADGSGVGLPVVWPDGAALPADTWVRVRGPVKAVTVAGQSALAVQATSVEVVPRPANPYLYP